MQYTLQNDKMRIKVNAFGGELVSVIVDGKEKMWQNPTGEWEDHSPILFPVCGHFGVQVNGKDYPMRAHGFAKRYNFTLKKQTEDSLHLYLASSEETKKCYPFDFVFHVIYTIKGTTLTVDYAVENTGDSALYFSCGAHESYALDTNVEDYVVQFEKEERFINRLHNDDGYMTGEYQDYGTGTIFPLPRDYLQEGRTVIFENVQSKKARLLHKDGRAIAEVCFDGFDNILLWREDNAAFICIEPWMNIPDKENVPDVEFSKKPGVEEVAPHTTKTKTHSVTYF